MQRLGEVDDLHRAVGERGGEGLDSGAVVDMGSSGRWRVSAEGLLEPFRDDVGVDLRVDEQRPVAALEPRGDGLEVRERADDDALGAGAAGDRGEVGVGELDGLDGWPIGRKWWTSAP